MPSTEATILPVRDLDHAEQLGARFAAEGIGLVELYGGLGADVASADLRGADSGVPVGFVDRWAPPVSRYRRGRSGGPHHGACV